MSKDIMNPVAHNGSGILVEAAEAERGQTYFCPSCRNTVIYRSGKTYRPHFAHKNKHLNPDCKPESLLHLGFKNILHKRISDALNTGSELPMQWKCKLCRGIHQGDLRKRAAYVKMEYDLGVCKPDIALIGESGRVVAVIEIVVSHEPETTATDYYKREGIPLVKFCLKSDLELSRAKEEVLKPDSNDACLNKRCEKCRNPLIHQRLVIRHGKCWKCQSRIKIREVMCDTGDAGVFSDEMIEAAAQEGAYISKAGAGSANNNKYDATICPKCNASIGDRPPLTGIIVEGNCPGTELDAGYFCRNCCNY